MVVAHLCMFNIRGKISIQIFCCLDHADIVKIKQKLE